MEEISEDEYIQKQTNKENKEHNKFKKIAVITLIFGLLSIGISQSTSVVNYINVTGYFNNSSQISHNNLSGLQGGVLNEYYHLDQSTYLDIYNNPKLNKSDTGAFSQWNNYDGLGDVASISLDASIPLVSIQATNEHSNIVTMTETLTTFNQNITLEGMNIFDCANCGTIDMDNLKLNLSGGIMQGNININNYSIFGIANNTNQSIDNYYLCYNENQGIFKSLIACR